MRRVPELPDDAIQAAAEVLRDRYDKPVLDASEFTAFAAEILTAAAPVMAEAVAAKITAHRDRHWPAEGNENPDHGAVTGPARRSLRRHFAIAARIAAGAFDTDEDRRRGAAEALAREDAVVCEHREDP